MKRPAPVSVKGKYRRPGVNRKSFFKGCSQCFHTSRQKNLGVFIRTGQIESRPHVVADRNEQTKRRALVDDQSEGFEQRGRDRPVRSAVSRWGLRLIQKERNRARSASPNSFAMRSRMPRSRPSPAMTTYESGMFAQANASSKYVGPFQR